MTKDKGSLSFVPELVSAAGDWCSLYSVVSSGADSVYFGVKDINMRQLAVNFDILEIKKVMRFLHRHNRKGYLALNVIAFDREIDKIKRILREAKKADVDAVILWDAGVLSLTKAAGLKIHLSTQASVSNYEAVKFYASAGAGRIVLARECSLSDIKGIIRKIKKDKLSCEVETFIHGAMCVSISGRCFLSELTFSKSANRGRCLQPCRREYLITDTRGDCQYTLGKDYLLSPKDLCSIDFIDDLIGAGINAFKIEGRIRSPEYLKVVTACYRKAIDAYFDGKLDGKLKRQLKGEIKKVYNRGLSDGFYFGSPKDAVSRELENQYEKAFVGDIRKVYKKIKVAEVFVKDESLKVGDKVLIIGQNSPAKFARVEEMQIYHESVKRAVKGDKVGVKFPFIVKPKDKLFVWRKKKKMKNTIIIIFTIVNTFLLNSQNLWAQNNVKQKIQKLIRNKINHNQNDNNEYKTAQKTTVDYTETLLHRFGVDGASPKWIKTIAELNDGWSGVNNLRWGQIEPAPPQKDKHTYRWEKIDRFLRNIQSTKRNPQINIRVFNDWALEYSHSKKITDDNTGKKTDAVVKIKPEHLSNWESFITAFVERYDADGYNDMPNLNYPITHIQIECEPENTWASAQGYIQALSVAYQAAKKANPDIQIMAAGYNMADLLALTPQKQQLAFNKQTVQHKIKFLKDFFAGAESYFDILSIHLNRDVEAIAPTVQWFQSQMRINGYQKPIWSEDTTSGPYLSGLLSTAEDKRELELLKKGDPEMIKWYQQEQAKLLIKKSVTAFDCDVEKVFISSNVDWPTYHMPIWRHMGLLDAKGGKKPAFYAFKTMVSKLDGFIKVDNLNLAEGIFGYDFTKSMEKVYVLWCEGEKNIDLSDTFVKADRVIITDIEGNEFETSVSQIHINSRPIFIEENNEKYN